MHYKCDQFEMYPFREITAGRDQKDAAQSAGGQGTCNGKTTVGIYEGYVDSNSMESHVLDMDGICMYIVCERKKHKAFCKT